MTQDVRYFRRLFVSSLLIGLGLAACGQGDRQSADGSASEDLAARVDLAKATEDLATAADLASEEPRDLTVAPDLRCPVGRTNCAGTCVDLSTDTSNCGQCGNACGPNTQCVNGKCDIPPCKPGLTLCNGACVDLFSDGANCGACGKFCNRGDVCTKGLCVPAGNCGGGLTLCNGACVDLLSDAGNCGACGVGCGRGEQCIKGVCLGGGMCGPCPMGQVCCMMGVRAGTCYDPKCLACCM